MAPQNDGFTGVPYAEFVLANVPHREYSTATYSSNPGNRSIMKLIFTSVAFVFFCVGCEDKKAVQAERDRQLMREMQRNENIQREKDRDQRAAETVVRALDVLTR